MSAAEWRQSARALKAMRAGRGAEMRARGAKTARDVTFFSEADRRWALGGCSSAGRPEPRLSPRWRNAAVPPPALVCSAPRYSRTTPRIRATQHPVKITWRLPFSRFDSVSSQLVNEVHNEPVYTFLLSPILICKSYFNKPRHRPRGRMHRCHSPITCP